MGDGHGIAQGLALAFVFAWAGTAKAFCGFYVCDSANELGNDSSFVVLLRDGTRTVMTMRNDYVGPPEDFAVVVPLPASITEEDVHVVGQDVLDELERFTAPRLVEYFESEPLCPPVRQRAARMPLLRYGTASVRIESSFAVGEYDFVVLGADDSLSLEHWLRAEGYRIPPDAAPLLRPYVAAGNRFLIAKVDIDRVTVVDGKAQLSPIRIAYDSPQLSLPLRLGLANSRGVQDVVVVVISRDGRFEVANRPNVFVPTNLEVRDAARSRFPELYASILDRTFERHPGVAITEHSWSIAGCDPCIGPTIDVPSLDLLGGDVISGAVRSPTLSRHVTDVTITRRAGDGHSALAVSNLIEKRRAEIERCGAGAQELDFALGLTANGRVSRLTTRHRGPCLFRVFRRARIVRPPLGRAHSEWNAHIMFAPLYRSGQVSSAGFTATRLHVRIKPDGDTRDLVFRRAPHISGGRGTPDTDGVMPPTVLSDRSTFQARYAILHRWTDAPECPDPIRTGWGGSRAFSMPPTTATASTGDAIEDLIVNVPPTLRRWSE